MAETPNILLTLEEFLQLPETKPASEFIDGQIVQKPMPTVVHSAIQGDLTSAINSVLEKDRKAFAFLELDCIFEGKLIVPDITVLPWSDIPRDESGVIDGALLSAPAWIIEVLSAEESQSRLMKKILRAVGHGTLLGWLIDPYEKCVFCYASNPQIAIYEDAESVLPVPDFASDFSLTVGGLFACLYE